MRCELVAQDMISVLDGRASAGQRQKLNAHAKECAACRERLEGFRDVWSALEDVPVSEPTLGFDARLRRQIAAEPRQRFWDSLMPAPRLAFAMAGLLAVSVWIARLPVDVTTTAKSQDDYVMIKDLRVLEDYDVISNFDALSELPPAQPAQGQPANSGTM
jgi:anti-sigma factor RsiW